MKGRERLIFFFFFVLVIDFLPYPAWAALRLNVRPLEGGNSIRFERLDRLNPPQEVKVRITATDGRRYQLYQRLGQECISEKGERLDRSALQASAQPGSNSMGTLYLQHNEDVGFAEKVIYSSNETGVGDSFSLLYSVDPARIARPGRYSCRLTYMLRSEDGSEGDQAMLDVLIDAPPDDRMEWQVSSGRRLRLSSDRPTSQQDTVELQIESATTQPVRIDQEWLQFPADERMKEIDPQAVQYSVSATHAPEGLRHAGWQAIDRDRTRIYSGDTPANRISVTFQLDPQASGRLSAGRYQGRLRYAMETADAPGRNLDLDVIIEIRPMFELNVEYPSGPLTFPRLLAGMPPQTKEVVVQVKNNSGRPYVVTQNVGTPLANERGAPLAAERFLLKVDSEGVKGKSLYPEFQSVPVGQRPLFMSDAQGSPAEFHVLYVIEPYPQMDAGNYQTSITYSLEQQ